MSGGPPYCIDPDQFLDLSAGQPISPEAGRAAWAQAYERLEQRLAELGAGATLYVVMGLQGAGKSTWVAQQLAQSSPRAIYFCGPLPSRRHRERALAMARCADCRCVAVWLNTPLAVALARNAGRSGTARIAEATIQHVHDSLQAPSLDEGFDEVIEVTAAGDEIGCRLATVADGPALLACDAHAQAHASRQRELAAWASGGVCWVAHLKGRVAGLVVLEHHFFGHGFVPLIAVAPDCRRRGVARALLRCAEQQCRTDRLFTSTNASNTEAQALLLAAGFVPSGCIENLDAGDPEWVYCKHLSGSASAPPHIPPWQP